MIPRLQVGTYYEILYQIPGTHRRPRYCRLKFLGYGSDDQLDFDARPKAGTQALDARWIVGIQELSPQLAASLHRVMLPRIVDEEISQFVAAMRQRGGENGS